MKTHGKTIVPRNPFAVPASQRKAGAHDKTEKARRHNARQALQHEVRALESRRGDKFDAPQSGRHPRLYKLDVS